MVVTPVQKIPALLKFSRDQKKYATSTANTSVPNNKNQGELNESEKNAVEAAAALLRTKQSRKS
jgi:electron transfer flavoprotein alpha/beta subunit